jgi:hypothetical protein
MMKVIKAKRNPPGCGGSGEEQGTTQSLDFSAFLPDQPTSPQRAGGNPWAVDNTTGFTPLHLANLRQVQERAFAEHGLDPCTLPQAAAHEAGHIIVAASLGDRVEGAKLFKSRAPEKLFGGRRTWLGTTQRERKTHTSTLPAFAVSPARLAYEVLNEIAGLVGEQTAGLDHPASSLDEVLAAQFACVELERRGLGDAEKLFRRAWGSCTLIIDRNRQQFDVVRGHLENRRRLTQGEADRMLARIEGGVQ